MLPFRSFRPFPSFVVWELAKELLVDRTAQCSLLPCGNAVFPDTLIKNGIDETAVLGAPYVVGSLLSGLLKGVAGELRREDGHGIVRTQLEFRLLSMCFIILVL